MSGTAVEAESGDVCASCVGACCADVLVGITGADAMRIAEANALDLTSFLTIASAPADAPGAFRLSPEGDAYAVLALARNPLDARACVFALQRADGTRRCGTHPSRPRVCRSYPMRIEEGELALRADVACAPAAWDLARVTRARWLEDLAFEASEWEAYARAVVAWNEAGNYGYDAFLAFVRHTYGNGSPEKS